MYDIIHILQTQTPNSHCVCCFSLGAANLPLVQRSDAGEGCNDPDLEMDPDKVCNYADQGPLPDRDIEEDSEILATLLKQMAVTELYECRIIADDIEQLLQENLSSLPSWMSLQGN